MTRVVLKTIGRVFAQAVPAAGPWPRFTGDPADEKPIAARPRETPQRHRLLVVAAVVVIALAAGCGHPRTPSPPASTPSQRFELVVEYERVETAYHAQTDSLTRVHSVSRHTHFGRVEPASARAPETGSGCWFVYNDSLRFQTEKPYRLEAFLSADTLLINSRSSKTAVSSEALGSSDSMLVCIFTGPALKLLRTGGKPGAVIENLKSMCSGGIYQRLDLLRTFGLFVAEKPGDGTNSAKHWEWDRDHPSFFGLGYSPRLRLRCENAGVTGETMTVNVTCDTTFKNVAVVLPNGERAEIIANRIQVTGSLRLANGELWHEGRVRLEENITYARPRLGTHVLTKTCVGTISLERF